MTQTTGITLFVVGILVSIMIHEWGHLWTARLFGMRADRYFLGFGPTLWSTRPGETEYGVKLLPLGGFVRILGMSPDDERLPPVADAWLEPDAVTRRRRAEAKSSGRPVTEVAALPESAYRELATLLAQRGTPAATTRAIVDAVRSSEPDTTAQARTALDRAIDEHAPAPAEPSTGSLHHRLDSGDRGRFFGDKPPWQRAVVLASGSALHFAIAIGLLFGGLLMLAQPTGDATSQVDFVEAGSPAAAAGLQAGDRILSINDTASEDFFVLRDVIRDNAGDEVTVDVRRDGEVVTLTATPERRTDANTGEDVGVLGFAPTPETERMGPGQALYETFLGESSIPRMTAASAGAIVDVFGPDGIGAMFGQIAGEQQRSTQGGISMVGGATVTGQGVTTYGVMFLISILVSVNVFIGVFNMLPLPPLDGGHLAVLAVEKVVNLARRAVGRPADFKVRHETVASIAIPVLVVIATVGLGLVWLDITNPIELP